MTKQRYFSKFEKCLRIFGHRLECTKPESSRLQNIVVDSGLRLPDCDTRCRRTEAVSDCCLRRHYKTVWSTKLLMSGSVSVAKGWHAEHFLCWILSFFINLFIFYRCPINSVVPPVPPLSEYLGGSAPASSMAPAPMPSAIMNLGKFPIFGHVTYICTWFVISALNFALIGQ